MKYCIYCYINYTNISKNKSTQEMSTTGPHKMNEKHFRLSTSIIGRCRCKGCKENLPQVGVLCLFNKKLIKKSSGPTIESNKIGCIVKHNHYISDDIIRRAFNNCKHCISVFTKCYHIGFMPSIEMQKETLNSSCPVDKDSCDLVLEYALNSFEPIWWLSQFKHIGFKVPCIYINMIIEFSKNFSEYSSPPYSSISSVTKFKQPIFKKPQYCSHISPSPTIIGPFIETNCQKFFFDTIYKYVFELEQSVEDHWETICSILLIVFKNFSNCKSLVKCLTRLKINIYMPNTDTSIAARCIVKDYFRESGKFFNTLSIHIVSKVIDMINSELLQEKVIENIPETIYDHFEFFKCTLLTKSWCRKKCAVCK